MLSYGYNAASKTLTATTAETIVFNPNEIPGSGVVQYMIQLTGTNNDYDSLDRVRIKASGQTIWDVTEVHLTALIQRLSRANESMASGDTNFSIPLYIPDGKGDERYLSGFPAGMSPVVEIDKDNSGGAGTAFCGWAQWSKPFSFFPMYLGSQMNIAASATNARHNITQPGLLRGFSLNTTGLDRARLVVGGREVFNLDDQFLLQSQLLENSDTATNPLFIKLHDPLPITLGGSTYLEVDTGAGWGGTSNELSVYTLVPVQSA